MAKKKANEGGRKIIAENRKARFNYEIEDTLEAGIVLTGTEVKALRLGKSNIAESYASEEGGELWLINSYIPEYLQANRFNHEPRRRRKLLVHARELARLSSAVQKDGKTIVPLKLYFNERGYAKCLVGLCKGRKNFDKRQESQKRDAKKEIRQHA